MAINQLIEQLQHFGISATVEYPGGAWGHSEEYLALRGRGVRGVIQVLERKLQEGHPKARLQLALVKNDPSVLIPQVEEGPEETEQ